MIWSIRLTNLTLSVCFRNFREQKFHVDQGRVHQSAPSRNLLLEKGSWIPKIILPIGHSDGHAAEDVYRVCAHAGGCKNTFEDKKGGKPHLKHRKLILFLLVESSIEGSSIFFFDELPSQDLHLESQLQHHRGRIKGLLGALQCVCYRFFNRSLILLTLQRQCIHSQLLCQYSQSSGKATWHCVRWSARLGCSKGSCRKSQWHCLQWPKAKGLSSHPLCSQKAFSCQKHRAVPKSLEIGTGWRGDFFLGGGSRVRRQLRVCQIAQGED